MSEWKNTRVWRALQDSSDSASAHVRLTIERWMPQIEKVLRSGGTSPADFTLHDADHSYRVAERMADVMPSQMPQELSSYELALLLLAAYLHDIGMTPEQRMVRLHYDYLLTGEAQGLVEKDVLQLQEWLDDHAEGLTAPIAKGSPTPSSLRLARELTAYYCRYRHNDWSEKWMRSNLLTEAMGSYVDWLDDLVMLCRSHHHGYNELVQSKFDPRLVGSPSSTVHLRYLAVVLRVADILDFDPERTPEVILRHRDIALDSLIYWWKDHHLAFEINPKGIVISARPPNARIHRAIEATAQNVERELGLARRLADEMPFESTPFPHADLPHQWNLPSSVHRQIDPRNNTYVYVDGSFRPNTSKFLELLSGLELYGTPFAAIREVLQNSFDAVRERIGYVRVVEPDPTDHVRAQEIARGHHVRLRFESSPSGHTLTCSDTGVGMTKAIICEHLLVSGTPTRHDVLELERKCKAGGFSLGRTGRFGIGVLAYFMVAERVAIHTQRGQECPDPEPNGWLFETEGIGSFGELRPAPASTAGTKVTLHLRADVVGKEPVAWFEGVRSYLKYVLVHVPCNFELSSNIPGSNMLQLSPGWASSEDELGNMLLKKEGLQAPQIEQARKGVMPTRQLRDMESLWKNWEEVRNEALSCLRWSVEEAELPGHLGRYRMHLPYFALPGGLSLGFLRVRRNNSRIALDMIGWGYALLPRTFPIYSWNGMRIIGKDSPAAPDQTGAMVEVDWTSSGAGNIAVNRNDLELSEDAKRALTWLGQRASALRGALLRQGGETEYATLNSCLAGVHVPPAGRAKWISMTLDEKTGSTSANWEDLTFPAIDSATFERLSQSLAPPKIEVKWRGNKLPLIPSLPTQFDPHSGLAFHHPSGAPERIVKYGKPRIRVAAIWDRPPETYVNWPQLMSCKFPPEWKNLCGVEIANFSGMRGSGRIWNRDHPLVSAFTPDGWQWLSARIKDYRDPLPIKGELLAERCRIAAWLTTYLWHFDSNLWEAIKERDPAFLIEMWSVLFDDSPIVERSKPRPLCQLSEMRDTLLVITPTHSEELTDTARIREYLPDPGPDWRLEVDVTEVWDLPPKSA